MPAIVQRIQVRRDLSTAWTTANPILASGEPGFETDTGKLKVGNGVALWNVLPYLGEDGGVLTNNANGTYTWTPTVGTAFTFGGVSADAGNLLSLGADFKPALTPAAVKSAETLTALTYNATTKVLSYADESGNTSTVNLAALAADIYVNGASFNATTGVLTLTDNDGATADVVIDLHALTGTLTNNNDGTYTYTTPSGSVTFDTKRASVSVDAGNALTLGADSLPYYGGPTLATAAAADLGTAAAGTSASVARADHVHKLPEFKELAAIPSLPAGPQLVSVTAAGAVVFIDVIDGGGA